MAASALQPANPRRPARAALPKPLGAILFALACLPASAMDLSTAYQQALQNEPNILASRASNRGQQERLVQAQAQLKPNIGLSAAANTNKLITTADNALGQPISSRNDYSSGNFTLQLRQPLYRKALALNVDQAGRIIEESDQSLANDEQELAVKVSTAYFTALLADDQVQLIQAQLTYTSTQLAAARQALLAGRGTRTDIDEAQARFDLATAQQLEAVQNAAYTRRQLENLVRQPVQQLAALVPAQFQVTPPDPIDLEQWIAAAQANSPIIKTLQARLDAARIEVAKAQAATLPTLDAVAQVSISQSENTSNLNTRYNNKSIGLQFNLPLYAGGAYNSQIRQTLGEQQRQEQLLDAARIDLQARVHNEYRGITEGASRIRALEQAVRSATQMVESSRQSRLAGVRSLIDVLNAEQQLSQALKDLAQARYRYILARITLWSLVGQADTQRLATINQWLAQP